MVRRLKSELPPDDGTPALRQARDRSHRGRLPGRRAAGARAPRPLRRAAGTPADDDADKRTRHRLRAEAAQEAAVLLAGGVPYHAGEAQEDAPRRARRGKRASARPSFEHPAPRELEGIEEDTDDDAAWEQAPRSRPRARRRAAAPAERRGAEPARRSRPMGRGRRRRLDAKGQRLLDWLRDDAQATGRKQWTDDRVIVFTEYRATQNWLQGHLAARGLTADGRLLTLSGGMDDETRERVKAAFQAGPDVSRVRILLATDAASEGIDLQNHCSLLIHYEIPWNPNRLEQRNGRVDRHGQRAPRVRDPPLRRQGLERAPGPRDAAAGRRSRATSSSSIEPQSRSRTSARISAASARSSPAPGRGGHARPPAHQLDPERHASRGRSPRRRSGSSASSASSSIASTRSSTRAVPSWASLPSASGPWSTWASSSPASLRSPRPVSGPRERRQWRRRGRRVPVPGLSGTWAACGDGLAHPHTGAIRPIVFDNDLARDRDDVVLAHLGHRLVQMCLRLLRAEVWAPEGQRKLHRVSARVVPTRAVESPPSSPTRASWSSAATGTSSTRRSSRRAARCGKRHACPRRRRRRRTMLEHSAARGSRRAPTGDAARPRSGSGLRTPRPGCSQGRARGADEDRARASLDGERWPSGRPRRRPTSRHVLEELQAHLSGRAGGERRSSSISTSSGTRASSGSRTGCR